MAKTTDTKKYTYDIAFSLCKQDMDFARQLVRLLNPSLNVFFYEDRQEELISKSGAEAFAKTFKDDSRVVIILSRKEWSETYYTDIERNAIIDRTSVKNEGYQFLMVIPMAKGEVPKWYPSTKIYADSQRFSIEELARFIEFKVTDEGGNIKSLTVEDRYKFLLERIEIKKSIIQLQHTPAALQSAKDEMGLVKESFNKKSELLRQNIIDEISWFAFNEFQTKAHFGYGDYLLECEFILPDEMYNRIVTTQDYWISFELFKTFGSDENKKSLEKEQRLFYYTPELKGWSLPHLYERATNRELLVLFRNRDNTKYYDLTRPLTTDNLIDEWFQKLLANSTQVIERYV